MEKLTLVERVAAVSESAAKRFQTLQKIQGKSLELVTEIVRLQEAMPELKEAKPETDREKFLDLKTQLATLEEARDWLSTL